MRLGRVSVARRRLTRARQRSHVARRPWERLTGRRRVAVAGDRRLPAHNEKRRRVTFVMRPLKARIVVVVGAAAVTAAAAAAVTPQMNIRL